MASEQGAVSAATAPIIPSNLSEAASTSPNLLETDLTRSRSLKRTRADQAEGAQLSSIANPGLATTSPSIKSPRFKGTFSPSFTPITLTGAAALEDERRKLEGSNQAKSVAVSENPGHRAIAELMAGGGQGMSRPDDAPTTTAMSAGMSIAANAITIPTTNSSEKSERSPASVTSLASLGSTAQTTTAGSMAMASPGSMTGAAEANAPSNLYTPTEDQGNRALSFPGNVLAPPGAARTPSRGLSLPMPGQGQQSTPRSPSLKKHKCPYCETEFTRHHNLKSHLLTHSQEKPYVCQTCSMRFRRLHDLKRHMKLHTGERPHTCPKCNRSFARGDALARHSKGQGGCAGRRASMEGFGGDDEFDGSNVGDEGEQGMEGVQYTNGAHPMMESEMTEEERRRFSLPSIKAQHVSRNQGSQDSYGSQSRAPSTYPPAGPRPGSSTSGLYPPTDRVGSTSGSQNGPPGGMSSIGLGSGGSMFAQSGGMTESPKPLSPGGMQSHQLGHDTLNRQRSPSLTTQFQQQHFGRRQSGRASPTMSLPSPHTSTPGPRLPALSGLAPPLPSQTGPPHGNAQPQSGTSSPGMGYQLPRSVQSSSTQGGGDNNLFSRTTDHGFMAYLATLEEQVKSATAKIEGLQNDNKALADQLLLHKQTQDLNQNLQNQVKSQQEQINLLSQQVASLSGQYKPPNQAPTAQMSAQ